ncbi:hypothetical protein MSAN_01930800 [Mycena sanguinolenta]|uniref:F-box domain-containing protein n=1 Tax=Mycena sanguinolenta TaxID=230812 RepID=A0A8H6XML5_9AGAR|nr:hypothetical protein MSAN_01930800 [Mycena sanguinolenta]
MSHSTLPPELIDTIICEIHDLESLKTCSLVVSSWRSPSQRILFDTLTVTVENCAALFNLLTESPHIANYTTNLIIKTMYVAMPTRVVESTPQILAKLQNVRRCTLVGLQSPFRRRTPPVPLSSRIAFPSVLLDFVVRQQLRELSLICVHIPTSVLRYLLTTVPKLSFQESVVLQDIEAVDIGQYAVYPQNIGCFTALRHLSMRSTGNEWSGKLIEAASRTLELIHLDCVEHLPLNLPHISVLLTDLPLATMLDAALAAYSTPSCINWFMPTPDGGTLFRKLADSVRRGMPEAHRTGRLVLEAHVPSPRFHISYPSSHWV